MKKNLKLLHIAPENRLTRFLLEANFANYTCGDLFTPGYTYASHVVNMNLLELEQPDNMFDEVICNRIGAH
ncbi:MAG: hypothetical protein ACK4K0_08035 [Flavobacteriales bacterium]